MYILYTKRCIKSLLVILCWSFCASMNGCGTHPFLQPVPDSPWWCYIPSLLTQVGWSEIPSAQSNSRSDAASGYQQDPYSAGISPYGSSIQTALVFHFQCPFLSCKLFAFLRDASCCSTSKLCMKFMALWKQGVICSSQNQESWDLGD